MYMGDMRHQLCSRIVSLNKSVRESVFEYSCFYSRETVERIYVRWHNAHEIIKEAYDEKYNTAR